MRFEPSIPRYLTEKELAVQLAVSEKWLQKKRLDGGGIPFVKFGNAVRYAVTAVADYEAAAARTSTSDQGRSPSTAPCLCNIHIGSANEANPSLNEHAACHGKQIQHGSVREGFPNA